MAFTERVYPWEEIRSAFVQRQQRPTFEELSAEFSCPVSTLHRASSAEGWAALRAQHLERQLAQSDAAGIILKAIRIDQTLITQASSVALEILEVVSRTLAEIPPDKAPAGKMDIANTASFTLKNVLDGLKSAGILGISKTLDAEGRGSGQWNPKLLNQINVVVDGLKVSSGPAQAQAGSSEPEPVTVEANPVS